MGIGFKEIWDRSSKRTQKPVTEKSLHIAYQVRTDMNGEKNKVVAYVVTGPDGKGKIFYKDDLQKNVDKIVNMIDVDRYANRFPSVTIDFARANVKKFGFIPCKEFTNDTTLPEPINIENMYKTNDTKAGRVQYYMESPVLRQNVQCVGIIKKSGKTVGARFLVNGIVNDVTTEALMKHADVEVQNAIIDKNGMVRGKPGTKLPIINL